MAHINAELIIGLRYDYGTLFKMENSEALNHPMLFCIWAVKNVLNPLPV